MPLRTKIECPECDADLVVKRGGVCPNCGAAISEHVARVRARERRTEQVVAVVATALVLITIGGAAGKTTTKEITATLARAIFGATLSTTGNLNNLIGVPMTLLSLTDEHHAAVIECGTNKRGEIPRLASIAIAPIANTTNRRSRLQAL